MTQYQVGPSRERLGYYVWTMGEGVYGIDHRQYVTEYDFLEVYGQTDGNRISAHIFDSVQNVEDWFRDLTAFNVKLRNHMRNPIVPYEIA